MIHTPPFEPLLHELPLSFQCYAVSDSFTSFELARFPILFS